MANAKLKETTKNKNYQPNCPDAPPALLKAVEKVQAAVGTQVGPLVDITECVIPKRPLCRESATQKHNRAATRNKATKAARKPSYRCEKVGTVAIDTGTVIIADPCRLDEADDVFDGLKDRLTAQLSQFVIGSQTGLGDGRYPVFAEIVDDGSDWGERVMSLRIIFDPVYCFADEPKYKEMAEKAEAEFLAEMNEE